MNIELGFLALVTFFYIGFLPVGFFKRDGQLNLQWWLTATPFLITCATVIASMLGYVRPFVSFDGTARILLECFSIACLSSSIALISFTLGTHRIPIALWHQENDAPKNIVTYGAYSIIRHPFYASFLLCFLGTFIACPHPLTLITLVWAFIVLNTTAAREERRLLASEFGKEYEAYMIHTGRFFPKVTAKSS